MRCQDAKRLIIHSENDLASSEAAALQEHLRGCSVCRAFEQRQQRVDVLLQTHILHGSASESRTVVTEDKMAPQVHNNISTERIMQAVQRQQRISRQLEDLHVQQQSRMTRLRPMILTVAAIVFFTLGSIPLLFLAITIVQSNLVVQVLTVLNNAIDVLIILAQYIQAGLILATRNNWLLSGVALVVVVMMAMWLRLMRPPQEVVGGQV